MRLKSAQDAPVAQRFGGSQQGVQFTGMVGVIVINFCTVVIALVLKTAACAGECGQALFHGCTRDF